MTADAKVGLLLGLFFIVIIAFLVNGLPGFIQEKNTSPLDAAIATPSGQDIILGDSLPKAIHRLNPRHVVDQQEIQKTEEMIVLDSPSASDLLLISIFHPVNFTANRTFCPFFPMASEV